MDSLVTDRSRRRRRTPSPDWRSYLRVIVTNADAVFVLSAAAVALTVTVAGFGTEFGAL